MNSESWKCVKKYLPLTYVNQAADAISTRENIIRQLLQYRKWPKDGWDDITIKMLINQLSVMDSNNFSTNCGLGERESRIASSIVAERHFNFGHGIGRSGDLMEVQPKAAGSSLMMQLTSCILKDVIKKMGVQITSNCLVMPIATSMALMMCLLTLKKEKPNAKFVIWSRIDQKACFKSILSAGLIPVIVDTIVVNDELRTDVNEIKKQICLIGPHNIICIMTTTSCFAPRAYDSIEEVGIFCATYDVPHVINNAYGLQTTTCMHQIQQAARTGRVDLFVQSTDKNIMVPVGGSIIAGFNNDLLTSISKTYPGRASASPIMDVFITLLSLGENGYMKFVHERKDMYIYLRKKLTCVALKHNERVLETPHNPISLSMTLNNYKPEHLTKIGSMLFVRNVSGARIITTTEEKTIESYNFKGWGAHCNNYPVTYLTAAASIGISKQDIDIFINRLDKVLSKNILQK